MKTLAEQYQKEMQTGDLPALIAGMAGKIDEVVKWIKAYEERERKE